MRPMRAQIKTPNLQSQDIFLLVQFFHQQLVRTYRYLASTLVSVKVFANPASITNDFHFFFTRAKELVNFGKVIRQGMLLGRRVAKFGVER